MKIQQSLRNHSVQPESNEELISLRQGKWQYYQPDQMEEMSIDGKSFQVRSGLTFTPFANPTRCNAHCRFCSEELQRSDQLHLTAKRIIKEHDLYFKALDQVLNDLSAIKQIGLSLSGLEATSDPIWLKKLLSLIRGNYPTLFDEKVLYTNASGLYTDPELINELADTRFDRLEISRCHFDDEINQQIMYFNRNEPIYLNANYEPLIRKVNDVLTVKNSCILTKIGINSIELIEEYLDWIIDLGVKEVVFRELSKIGENYINNSTKKWVIANTVALDPILIAVMPTCDVIREGWKYLASKTGYYYYNERFTYKGVVTVTLETSSYSELIARNQHEAIQKLIFHSNGNLCGDWDPDSHILGNYFDDE
ncbi:MAG: hypothetical protein AAFQ94_07900 [Bacteroidota bacterium]